MISRVSGKLIDRGDGFVIVDVGGIGYHVGVPHVVQKALEATPDGANITLETIYYFQIDQNRGTPVLIGFQNAIEREFFEKLLTVPKMGPKGAMTMFSRPVSTLATAIETANFTLLQTLSGVGRQKARDLVATLQGKLAKFALMQDGDLDALAQTTQFHSVGEEALQLLTMLGHKRPEAEKMVRDALASEANAPDAETLVRVIYRRQQEAKK
jgi:Holliday junction DNA helicase RuvA